MQNNKLKDAWDQSYDNKDNFVFFPHEEVIRFAAKFVVKRVGLNEFIYKYKGLEQVKGLDLGCGIGRHIIFFEKMNIDTYGIDLSSKAIETAQLWAREENIQDSHLKIVQGDITMLPWGNKYFNFIVSHGTLDSMPFEVARKGVIESHRVLKDDGLFYCDLISGDDSEHFREYAGVEVVETEHERNTIQSYFNFSKINELIKDFFEIEECRLIKNENCLTGGRYARYHLILRKI